MCDLWKAVYHVLCSIGVQNSQMERHMDQDTDQPTLAQRIQQRQIGLCLDFGPRIKDDGGIR